MQYFTFYFQFLLKAKHVISLRGVMRTSNTFLNEENSFDVVTLCEQTHVMHIQHLLKQESSIVHLSFRTVYLWCPDTFVCITAVANKAGKHTSLIVNFRHACILRHIGRQLIRPFLVLPQTTVISPVSFNRFNKHQSPRSRWKVHSKAKKSKYKNGLGRDLTIYFFFCQWQNAANRIQTCEFSHFQWSLFTILTLDHQNNLHMHVFTHLPSR